MATRQVRIIGDEILRKASKPVKEVTPRIKDLIADMFETMYEANGVGLAAPQVGILKRVCIVEYDGVLYELVNPVLVKSKGKCIDNEGCLSVEGFRGLVERPKQIDITYYDRNGIKVDFHAEGYFARVFLHEMDHLDGILFADKMVKKLVD